MRIVANEPSYDTRAVRRVIQAVARTFQRSERQMPFWPAMRVELLEGRARRARAHWERPKELIKLYLPSLHGTEFIGLVRQQHGGDLGVDHGGLQAVQVALQVQAALFECFGLAAGWHSRVLMDAGRGMLRGIPALIPLRAIKPAPPRDKLRDRLARTLELKKGWQRKAKLAATKLKKLGSLQRRYEKRLLAREAT